MGGMSLAELVRDLDTPTYVYDVDAMVAEAQALQAAFDGAPHLAAYAMKANSAGGIVRALAQAGCGADIVSGAELLLALSCGIAPERIVYSGVAKTDREIDQAIVAGGSGIGAIQIESVEEVGRVAARARAAGRVARVSLRVNPSVDLTGATHTHIATGHDKAKFGVPRADILRGVELAEAAPELCLVGMATHAGSQFMSAAPYVESARVLFGIVRGLRGEGRLRSLTFVNTGGGFGIDYDAAPPAFEGAARATERKPAVRPADFVHAAQIEQRASGLSDLALYVEPGRSLVAPFGVLVARVIQAKVATGARWLMIDAGMNDLLRPALYQARHRIVPLDRAVDPADSVGWRVVGPVCESSDDFGEHFFPNDPPSQVAILDAGAYGYTLASLYNGRQLPVEAFVRAGRLASRTTRASVESWVNARSVAGS